eukprot:scaffold2675_cov236-Pinguiococcus_pyrenoidosus.AAC.6
MPKYDTQALLTPEEASAHAFFTLRVDLAGGGAGFIKPRRRFYYCHRREGFVFAGRREDKRAYRIYPWKYSAEHTYAYGDRKNVFTLRDAVGLLENGVVNSVRRDAEIFRSFINPESEPEDAFVVAGPHITHPGGALHVTIEFKRAPVPLWHLDVEEGRAGKPIFPHFKWRGKMLQLRAIAGGRKGRCRPAEEHLQPADSDNDRKSPFELLLQRFRGTLRTLSVASFPDASRQLLNQLRSSEALQRHLVHDPISEAAARPHFAHLYIKLWKQALEDEDLLLTFKTTWSMINEEDIVEGMEGHGDLQDAKLFPTEQVRIKRARQSIKSQILDGCQRFFEFGLRKAREAEQIQTEDRSQEDEDPRINELKETKRDSLLRRSRAGLILIAELFKCGLLQPRILMVCIVDLFRLNQGEDGDLRIVDLVGSDPSLTDLRDRHAGALSGLPEVELLLDALAQYSASHQQTGNGADAQAAEPPREVEAASEGT